MSETKECAIVGGGLAGLVGYATLRHRGLIPAEIDVFGTDADPAGQWRVRAAAIRQRRMRSESDGHCAPRSFPGLAVRASLRDKSPLPLVESWLDRYHPTVEEFLEHVEEVRAESGWDESFRRCRVKQISAADGGFELDDFGPLPPRPRRDRPSRARVSSGARGRPTCGPLLPAARVRRACGDRRRGHGRRDRVAERARRRLGRRLGAQARTRAAPAQRSTPALHASGAGRVPRHAAGRTPRPARPLVDAFLPCRAHLGRAGRARAASRSLPRRGRAERGRPGRLRHRIPARLCG